MADVTKDSFFEENMHTKVVFQRGKDVLDFELNEFQDILRTQQYRALAAQAEGLNPGSNDDGYLITTHATPGMVTVGAGTLFCDGIPIRNLEPFGMWVPEHVGGGTMSMSIYLTVSEQEVADPAMVPQLGETTRRRRIFVEMGAALSNQLPVDSPQAVWAGGTRHFVVATIQRTTGVSAIAQEDINDQRFRLPAFFVSQWTSQYGTSPAALTTTVHNYNPPGVSDALVLRLSATGPQSLTGLNSDVQYKRKTLFNVGDSPITLVAESVDSVAANRFANGLTLYPDGAVDLSYDDVIDRWRVVSEGSAAPPPEETWITVDVDSAQASFNPEGWAGATHVRIGASSADAQFFGLNPVVTKRRKTLINTGGISLLFYHQSDDASDPTARIVTAQDGPFWLVAGESVEVYYDGTRWRILSPAYLAKENHYRARQYFDEGIRVETLLYSFDDTKLRGAVSTSQDILYAHAGSDNPVPIPRTTYIDLEDWGAGCGTSWVLQNDYWENTAGYPNRTLSEGGNVGTAENPVFMPAIIVPYDVDSGMRPLWIPLDFPHGAVIKALRVHCEDTSGAFPPTRMRVTIVRRHPNGASDVVTTVNAVTLNGEIPVTGLNEIIDRYTGVKIAARVDRSSAQVTQRVRYAECDWTDPGPRNT